MTTGYNKGATRGGWPLKGNCGKWNLADLLAHAVAHLPLLVGAVDDNLER